MEKVCVRCGGEKDETEFPLRWYENRSKAYRRNICRDCYNAARPSHAKDAKPEGRTCKRCGEYKPISQFPTARQCTYGVEPTCKACKLKRRREYVAQFPDRARNADLKYHYGITIEQYHAMRERQGGACAICGASDARLVVDHHHGTGQVRALLCHLCNALIGCAREDPAILTRAIAYLGIWGSAAQQAECVLVNTASTQDGVTSG